MNPEKDKRSAVKIRGEFTIFTAQVYKEQLANAVRDSEVGAEIDIDLSDVTEIDTAGIQLMVMAKREAASRGGNVRFVRHSDSVLDLIDLYALASQFGDPLLIHPQA